MNDGNSSASSPLMLKLGDTLSTLRLIEVENTAIDDELLNIAAMNMNRPVGSHTMLFGTPPITREPV